MWLIVRSPLIQHGKYAELMAPDFIVSLGCSWPKAEFAWTDLPSVF
jgi:hypothetical protein